MIFWGSTCLTRCLLLLGGVLFSDCLSGQALQFVSDSNTLHFGSLLVSGLHPAQLSAAQEADCRTVVQVFPQEAFVQYGAALPAMLGKCSVSGNSLVFKPRFPFRQGRAYQVILKLPGLAPGFEAQTIFIPETLRPGPATFVQAVFPSADTVPANMLKWYICFSAPMGLGAVYPHIELWDSAGQPVDAPFLQLEPPLWDAKQQRLTLWFDPGRIKQYLAPNTALGPPLLPEKHYTLHISSTFRDAYGQELEADYQKQFVTTTPDFQQPNPDDWTLAVPENGTFQALSLHFPESMDKGTLESMLALADKQGNLISGAGRVGAQEKSWSFTPVQAWEPGAYTIQLHRRLEDLAGNNLERPFDRDVSGLSEKAAATLRLEIPFSIGKE